MKKLAVLIVLSLAVMFLSAYAVSAAPASDFDFVRFAKEKVLTDFHPTAKPAKAVAEYTEAPFEREPGITRAKVHMYYSGWLRKHEMLVEMDLNKSDRSIKVAVLNDSNGMNLLGNSIFKENQWISLASIGWN